MLQQAIELLRTLQSVESDPYWSRELSSFLAECDAHAAEQSKADLAHAESTRKLAAETPPHAQVL